MNEIFNLWSPIQSENQALNIGLHPMQKQVNQWKLQRLMEEENVKFLNKVGIDINLLVDHEHWQN
jgi:transcriptional accessory protein Tex/SPT6